MSFKYIKNSVDKSREDSDLKSNPVMRYLRNQDYLRFNVGDVLIMQRKHTTLHGGNESWITVRTSCGAPKKFLYVFENELGIGYIKQLKVDGSGVTSLLSCIINYDPDYVRFTLDPDYADSIILGAENYEYHKEYADKKAFRDDAIAKNKKLLIGSTGVSVLVKWFESLKPGDEFWMGRSMEKLVSSKYQIVKCMDIRLMDAPAHRLENLGGFDFLSKYTNKYRTLLVKVIENPYQFVGQTLTFDIEHMKWKCISVKKPYPLRDALWDDHQK